MKIVGLITEYNPFHSGHRYHIKKAKELTNADYVIVITSGNYVQRGSVSFLDKYTKTQIAINNGADLVIELPYCYSVSSAEYFSYAAVSILDKLNIVDCICFGAENDNLDLLYKAAKVITDSDEEFNLLIKKNVKSGLSFPLARSISLKEILSNKYNIENTSFLETPNNILGIEYIKAIIKRNSKIKAVPLKRIIADYHDTDVSKRFYSATAIRKTLNDGNILESLLSIDKDYGENFFKSYPLTLEDFDSIMGYAILNHISNNSLEDIFGISKDLSNKITNNFKNYKSIEDFIGLIKTKDITYSHIQRALIHILLDIKKCDMTTYLKNDVTDYIRVLGVKKESLILLNRIKNESNLKIITKTSEYKNILADLPKENIHMFEENVRADDLYRMISMNKFKYELKNEFNHKFIIT